MRLSSPQPGLPGFYFTVWFAFFAPKRTPRLIIAKLNVATMEALAAPEVRARFADPGLDVQKADIDKW